MGQRADAPAVDRDLLLPLGQQADGGHHRRRATVNGGSIGPLTQRLYDTLTGIQWGTQPDPYGWVEPVVEPTSSIYLRWTPSSHSTWEKPCPSARSPARMEAA